MPISYLASANFWNKHIYNIYVLCVGRFVERKNMQEATDAQICTWETVKGAGIRWWTGGASGVFQI